MRLGRRVKFNMMIAILLCMAFVVNFGATLATTDYSFRASSVHSVNQTEKNTIVNYDAYAEFGSAQATSGKYIYKQGVYNNQLSINYGFNQGYDLMIKITATYSNELHNANDFSLNFVNRDEWVVDMGTAADLIAGEPNPTYYTMGSTTNTLKGVMYYMGTKTGSGSLPVISSVTFHTSPNNSYSYIGDTLTVTLTPEYVKANTANYGTRHSFYSIGGGYVQDTTAFNNWATYMKQKGNGTVAKNTSVMIYNSYVDEDRSLGFPYDEAVIKTTTTTNQETGATITQSTGEVDPTLKKQPTYSNTAYRYQVSDVEEEDGSTTKVRTYSAITAGNTYNGGLGVYVIPNSSLITVSVVVNYFWLNDTSEKSGIVTLEYSNDIQTITKSDVKYHYYCADIDKPTYINVLEYIMLTAEDYSSIIKNNARLILNNITVTPIYSESNIFSGDNGEKWKNESNDTSYEIHNSTTNSPILARVKDVVGGRATYDTNISITNTDTQTIAISKFSVSSDLWYGAYTVPEGSNVKKFNKTAIGTGYLPENSTLYNITLDSLIYDKTVWTCEYQDGIFTFTSISEKLNYIPSGYAMTLISGVIIPQTPACQNNNVANDFWCSLDITIDENDIVFETTTDEEGNVSENISYTVANTLGVEIITEGYYTEITPETHGKIYIRNNTNQIITGVSLTNLEVNELNDNEGFLPRDRVGSACDYTTTSHLSAGVSIKPNEMVLAYTIKPEKAEDAETISAIIYDFDLTVTLESGKESDNIDLIYNESIKKGDIINNGTNPYEFRLVSPTDLLNVLINPNDFVAHQSGDTYYYYYKGIIYPNRHIEVFKDFANNVIVDELVHSPIVGVARYQYLTDNSLDEEKLETVISNFEGNSAWGITEGDIVVVVEGKNQYQWFATWLNFMSKLYEVPTATERVEATIIPRIKYEVFTQDNSYTLVLVNTPSFQVDDGTVFTFSIQLNDGYKYGQTVVVSANGIELEATNGEYTITVNSNTEIVVEGIEVDSVE